MSKSKDPVGHGRAGGSSGSGDGSSAGGGGRGADRRASVVDRRTGLDRRALADEKYEAVTGLERRRGPGRRRSDFMRSAEEGEMNREQFLFLMAIEAFKQGNSRMFPTWTDVLEVIRLLGYRKTMPSELTLRNAEDWTERPDTPANVRVARGGSGAEDEEDEGGEESPGGFERFGEAA